MGTELQQILRSLCLNTEWKYAVFWKLKHRARMVLTWEDAYYDNCEQYDPPENKCFNKKLEKLHDGLYSHDPLGLAVAKMSYHVYSLGEGIVGQVAVTGRHRWIFAEKHAMSASSSLEYSDGWHTQFSVGIRTIAVVAVVPLGVVQLGSLNKVVEDIKLVTHIRDVFSALQDSYVGHIPIQIQSNMDSSLCLPDIPSKSLASENVPASLHNSDKTLNRDSGDVWLSVFPYLGKDYDSSYIIPLPGNNQKKVVDMVNNCGGPGLPTFEDEESDKSLQSRTNSINLEHHKVVGVNLLDYWKCGGQTSGCKDAGGGSVDNANPMLHDSVMGGVDLSDVLPAERVGVDFSYFPSNPHSSVCNKVRLGNIDHYQNGLLHASKPSDVNFQKDLKNLEFQTESGYMDTSSTSLKFPAGYELHEALGPAFLKRSKYFDLETEKTEGITPDMPEQMSSSQMTSDSCPEHLLEAVVASVCQSGSDVKSEKSFCKSVQSLLTTEKYPEPSSRTTLTMDSSNYSIDQPSIRGDDRQRFLSSPGVCGVMSPKGFSSTCPSACSEQLDRSSGPAKNNKKRSRPGENCRPRPRDRQLIQDRIKELRELIPNGAKCSIDSLLERTIKHMLFMQSITKHADKLNKSADTKLCNKETGMLGTSCERGSSWAVEVGGNLKVCSIMVENLNKNGQMVVEMMCEECSHFLEIAEAIRSLGLTILKGVTEARGDNTLICFVVEGQNNRSIHRMDILWSLVQILQPKNVV
ncbi:transcription factor bHLH155 isoform X2 [Ziziphus jujuba]|uniref:Transcription factor bHLH155 isoform X2 n=1 Tax=Ziziphus jujuba TaxID=326968 RepID=A0A6P4ABH7_ZIZJJ|nr:transcription factor bHLH155 isoform X2 [Ziziphus jujuba]